MIYEHEPLSIGGHNIRLLEIQPATSKADIELIILQKVLKSASKGSTNCSDTEESNDHEYEALSYVWGSPDRVATVFILNQNNERKELHITASLETALRHLRSPFHPRTIWADGICIDQDNLQERSREVRRMGSIFKAAIRTIFWLGYEAENSALALDTFAVIGQDVEFDEENHRYAVKPGSKLASLEGDSEALEKMRENWIAIRAFISRRFFQRLWIYQEIHLAKNAIIAVGDSNPIDWTVFVAGYQWVFYQSVDTTSVISQELNYKELAEVNNTIFQHKAPRWRDLFTRTSNLGCMDPRDRIYALLNLIHPSDALGIVPDYTKATADVYMDFMVRILQHQEDLNLFPFCMLPPNLKGSFTPPSWVPEFNTHGVSIPFNYAQACGKSRHEVFYDGNTSRLRVPGFVSDGARIICGDISVPRNSTLPSILEICREWAPPDLLEADYVSGCTLLDAFAVVLAAGEVQELRPLGWGLRPSIEESGRAIRGFLDSSVSEKAASMEGKEEETEASGSQHSQYLERWLPGRKIFTTQDGHMGLGPAAIRTDDYVAFALGCREPLILRKVESEKSEDERWTFRVVGTCYVHGYMNAEALLRSLPKSWTHTFSVISGNPINTYTYHGKESSHTQQLDPRLGGVLKGWSCWYRREDEEGKFHEEFDTTGRMRALWFEDAMTGEETRYDPRLSSQVLIQKKIEIRDLYFI